MPLGVSRKRFRWQTHFKNNITHWNKQIYVYAHLSGEQSPTLTKCRENAIFIPTIYRVN